MGSTGLQKWAHIGRIQLQTNVWAWSKLITDSTNGIQSISALAVDLEGLKIAAFGVKPDFVDTVYLFVLDAATGAQVSGLLKLEFTNAAKVFSVSNSNGMLMQPNGKVFMALK